MDYIKNWILSIVSAAVIGSVTLMLCPSGNMEKTVKTVISLFLLSSFIIPISNGHLSEVSVDDSLHISENDFNDDTNKILSELTSNEIENIVAQILNDNSVAYDDITAVVTENDDEIIIDKIVIDLTDNTETDKERVLYSLEEEIGYGIKIEVSDD